MKPVLRNLANKMPVVPDSSKTPAKIFIPVHPVGLSRIAPAMGEVVNPPIAEIKKVRPFLYPICSGGEICATSAPIREI